jgi:transcriptional regulator with XRE-family HTH domain
MYCPKESTLKFSTTLRKLRAFQKLSQLEVATQANISLRTYQRLEAAEAPPDLETICRLANIFNIDIESFVDYKLDQDQITLLNREDIPNEQGNQLFFELVEMIKNKEFASKYNGQEILKDIHRSPTFRQSDLPMIATNLHKSSKNPKLSCILMSPCALDEAGEDFENKSLIFSWINKVFGKKDVFGKTHATYKVKGTKFDVSYFFYSPCLQEQEHILLAYASEILTLGPF